MNHKIQELEDRLDSLMALDAEDKKTKANKWIPRELNSLHKKSLKKPEYVLVQYLRNNKTMTFKLCKVVSGNIVVIDNKGHRLKPKNVWRHKKYFWYIIGEWDTEPIEPRYYQKIKDSQRSTDNHPILMKMVLGAVQKKEETKAKIKAGWIIGLAIAGLLLFVLLG